MKNHRLLICAALAILLALLFSATARNLANQSSQSATKATSLLIGSFFRISQSSAPSVDRAATSPVVAYNPDDNEYLVVWETDAIAEVRGIGDIYGQRINGATNEPIGINFRISNNSDVDKNHSANDPKIVYNRTAREYLVVWHGLGLADAPDRFFEIYGQRLSRTGAEIGKDFRISHTADLGKINNNTVRSSSQVDVAWNSVNNEYLVIWKGMAEPEEFVKMEIYGQRVKATGELVGKHFRISYTTNQGNNFHANSPAIAYNSQANQYLVVWTGGFKKEVQMEVWGKLVPAGGGPPGTDDLRISDLSGSERRASFPHVAYNTASNEYLVVFQANPMPGGATAAVNDIIGQRINATKPGEGQPNYLRISNNSGAGSRVTGPRVIYNTVNKEFLVLWRTSRANAPLEVSGQRLSSSGSEIEADFQIANLASIGKNRGINDAALTHNSGSGRYFVVWQGNALPDAASAKVYEIFGQALSSSQSR